MRLAAGDTLGVYEIVAPAGRGAMGEVYRARDRRLKREVALKIIPEALAADAERVARFHREAEVLASLNHPHIAHVYGLEETGPTKALVMEFVEGDDLATRIGFGPMPLREALAIAKQIADALSAAHDAGIVHRDVKPANIRVRPDGVVKVLDFGLAKTFAHGPSDDTETMAAMTQVGVVVGTPKYMSPEQATGQPATRAADIWAFGCVLYEMLTGRAAFEGDTMTALMARVLNAEPDWSALPATTPPVVRRLLRRCLEKQASLRLRDIADARCDLEDQVADPGEASATALPKVTSRERLLWGAALGLVLVATGAWVVFRPPPEPAMSEVRLEMSTPPAGLLDSVSLSLSPDGQRVVFAAALNGQSQLWVRSLDSVTPEPLRGTTGGQYPFWSADSRSIAFFADSSLKRLDIDTGTLKALARAQAGRGGTWNSDGVILFAPTASGAIFRIAATGGEPAAVTKLDLPRQTDHRSPSFLPDGRHFLYYARGTTEGRGVYLADLESEQTHYLADADAGGVYISNGYVLFVRLGSLIAQRLDVGSAALTGSPIVVADRVAAFGGVSLAGLSAAADGTFVYGNARPATRQLIRVDRAGREVEKIGAADDMDMTSPSLAPDGRRVAVSRFVDSNWDIWGLEIGSGALTRVTSDPAIDYAPIWSPDGRTLAFRSGRRGRINQLYTTPSDGGTGELLLETPLPKYPNDWSRDGRVLLYHSTGLRTANDIWALRLDGDRQPAVVVQSAADERDAQLSDDGKWIAYQSNDTGRYEIYVQRFDQPGGRVMVSNAGGAQVRWRRDGKELFYVALDGQLMAAPVRESDDERTLIPGAPVKLFASQLGGALQDVNRQQYIVEGNGQHFLVNRLITNSESTLITVVMNWQGQ